jgi:hypothetical protein
MLAAVRVPVRDTNSDVMNLKHWPRRFTRMRSGNEQSSLAPKIILLERYNGLRWLRRIRILRHQRDEFSLCTSKFESDMPSHGVGLRDVSRRVMHGLGRE